MTLAPPLLLTIVVPTYNRDQELKTLFNSIPRRVFDSIEILLIDDGSKDSTERLAKHYKEQGYPIIYLYQENSGRHIALKSSLGLINGCYTIIFDSDDFFLPYGIDLVLEEIQKCNALVDVMLFAASNSLNKNIEGVNIGAPNLISECYDYIQRRYDKKEVVRSHLIKMASVFWGFNERRVPTLLLWLEVSEMASSFRAINIPIAYKNYLPAGISSNLQKILLENPRPMMVTYQLLSNSKLYNNYVVRLKSRTQYYRYALHSSIGLPRSDYARILFWLGLILYIHDILRYAVKR
jgi:glycosyltransferase involved in cell wall biosynthesis